MNEQLITRFETLIQQLLENGFAIADDFLPDDLVTGLRQQNFHLLDTGQMKPAGIGREKSLWLRSSLMGLAAGIGAVTLPGPLGLEERHTNKTLTTKLMTVGLYVAGSIVTAAIIKLISSKVDKRKEKKTEEWEKKLVTSAMG